MRASHPWVSLLSATLAALAVLLAARQLVDRARADGVPRVRVAAGETLEDFTRERRRRELALRRLLEEGRWAEAEEAAADLLDFDPINGSARDAIARSREERVAARALDAALRRLEEGKEVEALSALRAVPGGTEAHARARIEAEPLAERVARRARGDCLGLVRAGRHVHALESCRLHLDLVCARGADPAIVDRVRWLERRLGVGEDAAWRCPEGGAGEGAGDARVRAVLRSWERGEAGDHAALRLERLAARGVEGAEAMLEPLRRAEARLREATAALLEGDLERARRALLGAAEAEAAILGTGRSLRFRESVQHFGRLALERGLELEAKHRHAKALRVLRLGAELDPANPEILRALWRVEDRVGF